MLLAAAKSRSRTMCQTYTYCPFKQTTKPLSSLHLLYIAFIVIIWKNNNKTTIIIIQKITIITITITRKPCCRKETARCHNNQISPECALRLQATLLFCLHVIPPVTFSCRSWLDRSDQFKFALSYCNKRNCHC